MFKVDLPYTRKAFFHFGFFSVEEGKTQNKFKIKDLQGDRSNKPPLCWALKGFSGKGNKGPLKLIQVGIDIDTNLIPFQLY